MLKFNQKYKLRIATRQSPLALWQSQHIARQLQQYHGQTLSIEILPMLTSGDRLARQTIITKGLMTKGLFVKELETALLNHQADLAVHSLKDVPAQLPEGLIINTICKRDNPFDVLISKSNLKLNNMPPNSIIGTSSLRRQAQLLAYRQDLQVKTIHGNINTRLNKLQDKDYDAIILAAAGLERMDWQDKISERLAESIFLPACGQGTLAIECRCNDIQTRELLAPLHDHDTAVCAHVERHVNTMLGGSCNTPLAIYCTINPMEITSLCLQVKVMSHDGKKIISHSGSGTIKLHSDMVDRCVTELIQAGVQTLLAES